MHKLTTSQLEKFKNNHFEAEGLITLLSVYIRFHSRCREEGVKIEDTDCIDTVSMNYILLRMSKIRDVNYSIVVEGI